MVEINESTDDCWLTAVMKTDAHEQLKAELKRKWPRLYRDYAALEAENVTMKKAIQNTLDDAKQQTSDGCFPVLHNIKELQAALFSPTGKVLVDRKQIEKVAGYLRTLRMDRPVYDEDGYLNGHWQTKEWLDGLLELSDMLAALLKEDNDEN